MKQAQMHVNDPADICAGQGGIVIEKRAPFYDLARLVNGINDENLHDSTDTGAQRDTRSGDLENWVPDAGDIIWLHLTPHAGHEQAGHRLAIVLTR